MPIKESMLRDQGWFADHTLSGLSMGNVHAGPNSVVRLDENVECKVLALCLLSSDTHTEC